MLATNVVGKDKTSFKLRMDDQVCSRVRFPSVPISFTCLILLGGPYDLILSGGSYDQVQQLANLQSSALLTRHNTALLIAHPGLHPTRVI